MAKDRRGHKHHTESIHYDNRPPESCGDPTCAGLWHVDDENNSTRCPVNNPERAAEPVTAEDIANAEDDELLPPRPAHLTGDTH